MNLICIDIGNTHVHWGLLSNDYSSPREHGRFPTRDLGGPRNSLGAAWRDLQARHHSDGIAFCSVVPAAGLQLEAFFQKQKRPPPLFHLNSGCRLGIAVSYPNPEQIGEDRLANAVAAGAFYGLPSIVIDLGTAVTFDILTAGGGYEGGIIAPGLAVMTRYLHEQTALLPALDEELKVEGAIGQSTEEAMKLGCLVGFGGMISALLARVEAELERRGEPPPQILSTGGSSAFLPLELTARFLPAPYLTLQGLARAFALNPPPDSLS